MGKRGPLPQPTALKVARGNPGKRKLLEIEPQPQIQAPKPPRLLSKYAKKEWKRIVPQLIQMKVLTQVDRTALAMYCQAYGRWKKAEEEIKVDGEVITVGRYSHPQQSPWLAVSNTAWAQMVKSLAQFGLSPSARTRIEVPVIPVGPETEKEKVVREIVEKMDQAGAKINTRAKA